MWYMFKAKAWIALLMAVCMILPGCGEQEQNDSIISEELIVPEQMEYETTEVSYGSMFNFSTGRGQVEYTHSRKLSWDIANCVIGTVFVSKGANVKQGDPLVSFVGRENTTALESRKLALSQREMEVAETKNNKLAAIDEATLSAQELTSYERIVADQEILKLQIDYEQYVYETGIELSKLRSELAELEYAAEERVLTAPFDGQVEFLTDLVSGSAVTAGKDLIELFSYEEFIILVDDSSIRYNMEVSIDMMGGTYEGRVISAGNILPSSVSDNKVRIKLEGEATNSRITGRVAYTVYPSRVQDVLQVNRDFINFEETKRFVYILDGDVIRKRYITVGLTNRKAYWILDGLDEGQTLVIS